MTTRYSKSDRRAVLRIVIIYVAAGSLWIYLSDSVLGWLVQDPRAMTAIATYKGLLFIALTSLLLYFLISRFVVNISEKNRQLKISEDRFQCIFHGISDAIFIHDAGSGAIIDVNRTAAELFGYDAAEMVTMTVNDISLGSPPYSQHEALEWLRRAAAGTPQQFEWLCKKRSGATFWTDVSMRTETVGEEPCIIVSVRDISERKEFLEEFQTVIRTTKDGFNVVDNQGKLLEVNQPYCDMIGYSRDELLQMTVADLEAREQAGDVAHHIKTIIANGSDIFETRHRRKDGTIIDIQVSITYLPKYGGRFYAFIRDISDRTTILNERLKMQKLESLGVLAGGIAHDFNNILTIIMGNISFARRLLDPSHRSFAALQVAEKASQRASDLAHQLLTFSKGGRPVKKTVPAPQLINASVSFVLRGSNIRSMISLPDNLYPLEVDEGQINQAFNNIIINAVQAMPGGGTITISAENISLASGNAMAHPAGNYVNFTFADSGCGMSPETVKRIFDPYFTTKAGGNGLGLASAYSIVSKHGGYISVSSTPGQGSTFCVLLPASDAVPAITPAATEPSPADNNNGKAILVMDDEEMIRDLASEVLLELGFRVTTCANGDEAISLYKTAHSSSTPFFAVIMDLTIASGKGGKEAAREILDFDSAARLIVSSGYSNDPVMAEYKNFGFAATIGKPYTFQELATVISSLECTTNV